ncbi:transglutaminase family protein [Chitinophaga sp. CF418]|uniref:transglutaminase-like domain-containing protein n=1 Tax=Chitinophaga sp. CF418 TaxID=1855287 RepID=UPI0009237FAD|nr:transglutaminase family protein [Chitinophaga sp. CF418]SHL99040.1 Transglutaminase-like enzyme, putative cysteine protease [Chitinophaga sp. CF418]
MLLQASSYFEMYADDPVTSIFMLRSKSGPAQSIRQEAFLTTPQLPVSEYIDGYGNICQRIIIPAGTTILESRVIAECDANIDVDTDAGYKPVEELPDDVLQFLLPSRYCESDKVAELAMQITMGIQSGYSQVGAIRQWCYHNISREYGTTNSSTSAVDVLQSRTGVCRDFAHVAIALCRSMNIPARMVVGYLYDLKPMDLHAWFEAFVGDRWYIFDALMPDPVGGRIIMAYGRDAADVAFASHFGNVVLTKMEVKVIKL